MAKTTGKKRNPQDATLRNIRALKGRVMRLEEVVAGLVQQTTDVALTKKIALAVGRGKEGVGELLRRALRG